MDDLITSEVARSISRHAAHADRGELARAGVEALERAETAFRPERGRFRPFARKAVRRAVVRKTVECEGLVKKIALNTAGYLDEDILQAGHEGIARARVTYDPAKGAFAAYACAWIRHFVQLAMAESRVVRGTARRAPTYPPVSMDAIHDDAGTLHDVIPGPDAPATGWGELVPALEALTPRERHVITREYRDEGSHADIAVELGVHVNSVGVIKARALVKMRAHVSR